TRVNDYPTPSFYSKVRVAAEEARLRGLFLDLTLGSGWPFGGGDVTAPWLASIELRFTRKALSGPSHFHDRIVLPPPRATAGMNLARQIWVGIGGAASGLARATAGPHSDRRDPGDVGD